MITLCGMVLYPTKYTQQKERNQNSLSHDVASLIAKAVMEHFQLQSYKKFKCWVKERELFCRGEEVNLDNVLAEYVDI